jgi:Cd2+/Zn2+-exporting ATPase
VAIHSAGIALLSNSLDRIPFLIELSRRTIAVIRQNLVVGAAFIVVFLALAAAGFVSPVAAALLHVVSGLVVIFNSARLVRCGEEIDRGEPATAPVSPRRDPGTGSPPG